MAGSMCDMQVRGRNGISLGLFLALFFAAVCWCLCGGVMACWHHLLALAWLGLGWKCWGCGDKPAYSLNCRAIMHSFPRFHARFHVEKCRMSSLTLSHVGTLTSLMLSLVAHAPLHQLLSTIVFVRLYFCHRRSSHVPRSNTPHLLPRVGIVRLALSNSVMNVSHQTMGSCKPWLHHCVMSIRHFHALARNVA